MLDIVYNILLFLHVLVCLLLVLIVMMQRPKQEGLGSAFASGMMNEIAGAQTTDVLQKGTRILAISFFVLAAVLAMIKAHQNRNLNPATPPAPAAIEETTEEAPATQDSPIESTEEAPAAPAPESTTETGDEAPAAPESAETAPAETAPQPADAPAEPATEAPAPQQ